MQIELDNEDQKAMESERELNRINQELSISQVDLRKTGERLNVAETKQADLVAEAAIQMKKYQKVKKALFDLKDTVKIELTDA